MGQRSSSSSIAMRSPAQQSALVKKTCRYFSSIITLTHKLLKISNEALGKPLAMHEMNREFEPSVDQPSQHYACDIDSQHPVNALETFMRDVSELDEEEQDREDSELTQAQTERSSPCPSSRTSKATLLKRIALFVLHCYVRIYLMQDERVLREPHCVEVLAMIAQSDMLRRLWQSEMDDEMRALAAQLGVKVRDKIFRDRDSASALAKLLGSPDAAEDMQRRWKEIYSGHIQFRARPSEETVVVEVARRERESPSPSCSSVFFSVDDESDAERAERCDDKDDDLSVASPPRIAVPPVTVPSSSSSGQTRKRQRESETSSSSSSSSSSKAQDRVTMSFTVEQWGLFKQSFENIDKLLREVEMSYQ